MNKVKLLPSETKLKISNNLKKTGFPAVVFFCVLFSGSFVFTQTNRKNVIRQKNVNNPESVVKSFIEDYFRWNDASLRAIGNLDSGGYQKSIQNANAGYNKIIEKYCRPLQMHQGVSYGTDPEHNPAREKIISVKTTGDRSIIKTRQIEKNIGVTVLTTDYEYHLSYADQRWYLDQVYITDEDEKYETL